MKQTDRQENPEERRPETIEEVEWETKPCPLGCKQGDEFVLKGRDRINNLPGEFTIVRCRGCGLMRTDPRPTPETMGFYYPDSYGPYLATKVADGGTSAADSPLWKQLVHKTFRFNWTRVPPMKPGRLLEIGCASGAFLHEMAAGGWKVKGIEFSSRAAANARSLGYPVHAGSVEAIPDFPEPFDLVAGWAVLEHLHEPLRALESFRRWTSPDALLALSVPNIDGLGFRLFKDAWFGLHLPNHLFHFSIKTLQSVLEKSGWSLIRVFYQRHLHDPVASLGYSLQDRGHTGMLTKSLIEFPVRARRANFLLYPLGCLLSLSGKADRMTVWAKKR